MGVTFSKDRLVLAISIILDPVRGLLTARILVDPYNGVEFVFWAAASKSSGFTIMISDDFALSGSEIVAAKDGIGEK